MTNNTKEPEKEEPNNDTNASSNHTVLPSDTPTPSVNKERSKPLQRWSQLLLPLMAAGALILALNATYQNWLVHKVHQQQQEKMLSKLNTFVEQQQATNHQLTNSTNKLKQLKHTIQTQINEQNKELQTVLQQHSYQQQDWLLLKARYYLELAQINANWTDNQQTTLGLLQQADRVLQEITQQKVLVIRQVIAQEITQLKALPVIDKVGLLSQLDAAQTLLPNLPINQPLINQPFTSSATATVSDTPINSTTSSWREKLHNSLQLLEKLVIIRRNNNNERPIFSPLHQALLRESIRLNLQAAQWAILQNNTPIYQQSLKQALNDIERTFDSKANSTQSLIKQLQELQHVTLQAPKPVVDKPLLMLNQLIESKNSAITPSSTTNEAN